MPVVGNRCTRACIQLDMDDDERIVIRDEGDDPDAPAIIATLARVSLTLRGHRCLVDELLPALGLRRTASFAISADSIDGGPAPAVNGCASAAASSKPQESRSTGCGSTTRP